MSAPFRLIAGRPGPVQRSSVSCGSACLVVARMLRDPDYAARIVTPPESAGDRFAQAERTVMRRTNALAPFPGRLQVPWPRALGTPPWGALGELERRIAPGTAYGLTILRGKTRDHLATAIQCVEASVQVGAPALLYVGNDRLPRHVTLLHRDRENGSLLIYEPSQGAVTPFDASALLDGSLRLAGWSRSWFVIHPVTASSRGRGVELERLREIAGAVRESLAGQGAQPA